MTKTVSVRVPNSLHDELRERCNLLGDPISDFVEAAIELILTGSTDYDFGDEIVSKLESQKEEFERKSVS
jgi:predicted DNA-binding protein